jgi:hypothetical protein
MGGNIKRLQKERSMNFKKVRAKDSKHTKFFHQKKFSSFALLRAAFQKKRLTPPPCAAIFPALLIESD